MVDRLRSSPGSARRTVNGTVLLRYWYEKKKWRPVYQRIDRDYSNWHHVFTVSTQRPSTDANLSLLLHVHRQMVPIFHAKQQKDTELYTI
jgi:hypothetical protein